MRVERGGTKKVALAITVTLFILSLIFASAAITIAKPTLPVIWEKKISGKGWKVLKIIDDEDKKIVRIEIKDEYNVESVWIGTQDEKKKDLDYPIKKGWNLEAFWQKPEVYLWVSFKEIMRPIKFTLKARNEQLRENEWTIWQPPAEISDIKLVFENCTDDLIKSIKPCDWFKVKSLKKGEEDLIEEWKKHLKNCTWNSFEWKGHWYAFHIDTTKTEEGKNKFHIDKVEPEPYIENMSSPPVENMEAYVEYKPPPVGGIAFPPDKLALLAPYIILAALIAIPAVSVAVYWRRYRT